ncbi:hypothetical protein JG687_00007338 [Phytophthora cactorum]|uniref:BZIP domain-containing protein n=1 Tax=Phytophthora cactorum TaxID=29920 RepID=A0A8T1UFG5_9STRA|nr:hypothetical protein JG687_00007338 [Phytophthora cactorum]
MQITLQPPGIHTLSHGVIGSVVPRFWAAHDRLRNGQVQYIQRQTQLHSPNHPCADVDMKRITSDGPHLNSSKQTLMGSLHLQRSATRRSVYKRYELSECQGMKEKGGFAASLTSCDYNRRYRERKRKYEEALKNSKQQLEGQIIQLRRQRDQLTFQESRCLTVWTIATEYFRIFRRGILTQDDIHPTDFDFLHAAITPDVLKDATSEGAENNYETLASRFFHHQFHHFSSSDAGCFPASVPSRRRKSMCPNCSAITRPAPCFAKFGPLRLG